MSNHNRWMYRYQRIVCSFFGSSILFALRIYSGKKKRKNKNCSVDGSYQMGLNDGQHRRRSGLMALQKKCPQEDLKNSMAKYEEGYKAGGGKPGMKNKHGQDMFIDFVSAIGSEGHSAAKDKDSKSESVDKSSKPEITEKSSKPETTEKSSKPETTEKNSKSDSESQ